jgi:hypothetical protein
MKNPFLLLFFFAFGMLNTASAQGIELPRLSPKASVSYTVGMTEVTVHYSAPAVNERKIWGGLVPYNQLWRAGANEATTVEFSTEVNLEGQTVRAGKYALFLIPGEDEWTVILNKVTDQWGTSSYDENQDEVRFTVKPKMNEGVQERLMYSIHDMNAEMGYIKLSWEKMRLYLRFKVDVMDQAMANIAAALVATPDSQKWAVYTQGAKFLMDVDGNLDQALSWAKLATEQTEHSWAWFVRAKVEAKKGDMAAAVASGTKCAEIGLMSQTDTFYKENAEEVNAYIQSWASKMN